MLIVKAYINEKEIDEIWIHNVNTVSEDFNIYEYRICKPEGYEDIPLYHVRSKGWRPLAADAIKVLEENDA